MNFGNERLRRFTELLDRTAEKNPLLWLPCVLMLTVIFLTSKLVGAFNSLISRVRTSQRTDVTRKPFVMRVGACVIAAAFTMCMLPNFAEIGAFAEENDAQVQQESSDNTSNTNNNVSSDFTEETSDKNSEDTNTDAENTDKNPDGNTYTPLKNGNSKENMTITLNCDVANITKGTAHISTRKEFFDNSAELRITNADSASEAAAQVMSLLGANASYYAVYPFDVSLYDADSGEKIDLKNKGYITVELPTPKSMRNNPERIKVYHIKDGMPEPVESEVILDAEGRPIVRFNTTEFSNYMFVAPSYEDVSSAAGAYDGSAPVETAAVPTANGVTVPCADIPKDLKFSNKKRRYRILRRRNLDDLVFVY